MRPVPITMFATAALLAIGISLPLDESQAQANDGVVMTTPISPPRMPRADRPQSSRPQPQQNQATRSQQQSQPQLRDARTNGAAATAPRAGGLRPQ